MKTLSASLFALIGFATCLAVSQDSNKFAKWKKPIAAFEARDEKTPPPVNCLLFVGSSSIRMWKLEDFWPDQATINNGFGGSTLADSIHFFDRVIAPYQPKAVILYAGDNDINKGLDAEETFEDFRTLSGRIRDKFPEAKILYLAIKPSRARWKIWPEMEKANRLIAEHCSRSRNLVFVDTAAPMLEDTEGPPNKKWFVEDGLHLSDYGYRVWTELVQRALSE
jgi:lysophospholipase L1-like esterase